MTVELAGILNLAVILAFGSKDLVFRYLTNASRHEIYIPNRCASAVLWWTKGPHDTGIKGDNSPTKSPAGIRANSNVYGLSYCEKWSMWCCHLVSVGSLYGPLSDLLRTHLGSSPNRSRPTYCRVDLCIDCSSQPCIIYSFLAKQQPCLLMLTS